MNDAVFEYEVIEPFTSVGAKGAVVHKVGDRLTLKKPSSSRHLRSTAEPAAQAEPPDQQAAIDAAVKAATDPLLAEIEALKAKNAEQAAEIEKLKPAPATGRRTAAGA